METIPAADPFVVSDSHSYSQLEALGTVAASEFMAGPAVICSVVSRSHRVVERK